jgi:hypothetical protein
MFANETAETKSERSPVLYHFSLLIIIG